MMLYGATGGFNYRATVVCNYGQMQAMFMGMALLALVGCASVPVPTPTPADSRSAPAETPIISGEPPVVVRPRENITPQAGAGVLAMLQKAEGHVQAHTRRSTHLYEQRFWHTQTADGAAFAFGKHRLCDVKAAQLVPDGGFKGLLRRLRLPR